MTETNSRRKEDPIQALKLAVENNEQSTPSEIAEPSSKADSAEMGPQGTMVFGASQVNQLIAGAIANQKSEEAQLPALIGISEGFNGYKLLLDDVVKVTVGRDNNCDLELIEPSVSAMHARIVKKDEGWKVINMLSSNGTFVNDKKCHEPIIKPGDRIRFGRVEFLFSYISRNEVADEKIATNPHSFWLGAIGAGIFFAILLGLIYWL